MRKLKLIILLVMTLPITAVFIGCGHRTEAWGTMDMAEAVMESRPDSALVLMSSINKDRLGDSEEKARYALLISMAKHKNYIDETDDSLINIAADYYTPQKDLQYAIMSRFYRARVLYNAGRYDDSILSAMEAEEMSSDSYTLWNARCNELIGDIYNRTMLPREEIKRRIKTISAYHQSGKELNELYARCNLANAYCDNAEYEKALQTVNDIESSADISKDSVFTAVLLSTSLPIMLQNDRNIEVIERFNKLKNYDHLFRLTSQDFRIAAFAQINLGDIEQAKALLSDARSIARSKSDENLNLLLEKAILQKNGDAYSAMLILDSLLVYQNEEVKNILSQSVLNTQQKYYADKNAKSMKIIEKREKTIWLVIGVIINLSAIVYLVVKAHFVKIKKKLTSTIEDLYVVSEELISKDRIISEVKAENYRLLDVDDRLRHSSEQLSLEQSNNVKIESMVAKLLSRQFSTINSLCEQYYDDDSPVNLKMLYHQVSNELDKISSDETMRELSDIVNLCRNDIINRIVNELPSLSQKDINFLTLLYSGFSIKAIAVIFKMRPKGVYTKRQRLFERIRLNTSIDPNEALE